MSENAFGAGVCSCDLGRKDLGVSGAGALAGSGLGARVKFPTRGFDRRTKGLSLAARKARDVEKGLARRHVEGETTLDSITLPNLYGVALLKISKCRSVYQIEMHTCLLGEIS